MSKNSKFDNIEYGYAQCLLYVVTYSFLVLTGNLLGLNEGIHMATTKFKIYYGQTEVAHTGVLISP
jgi:hypothetical protein